jgi:hypothetical protein
MTILACGPSFENIVSILVALGAAPLGFIGWALGSAFNNKTPAMWLAVSGTVITSGGLVMLLHSLENTNGGERLTLVSALVAVTCCIAAVVCKFTQRGSWKLAHYLAGTAPALLSATMVSVTVYY